MNQIEIVEIIKEFSASKPNEYLELYQERNLFHITYSVDYELQKHSTNPHRERLLVTACVYLQNFGDIRLRLMYESIRKYINDFGLSWSGLSKKLFLNEFTRQDYKLLKILLYYFKKVIKYVKEIQKRLESIFDCRFVLPDEESLFYEFLQRYFNLSSEETEKLIHDPRF